jgi:AAA+ superfamily predicted ATPase
MSKIEGKFKPIGVTALADLKKAFKAGEEVILPESDLCFQDGGDIYQFEYVRPEDDTKYEIKPGIFLLTQTSSGIKLTKTEMKERSLLETVTNTAAIMREAKTFFNRLHVYEQLERPKKRGVLLYSAPGMGKTSAIERFCLDFSKEDAGTVVLIWPTSEIEADDVSRFLTTQSEYLKECTRLVLIMEDIGGGERGGEGGPSPVDSGLLNLLDGVGITFKLPTFIVATTNHPENLLSSLANRPGRFDLMLKLAAPNADERKLLMKFIAKRDITEEEANAITQKGTDEFSIAHLEEIAVRALLHEKTYAEVVKELLDHTKLFKRDFAERDTRMGIG